MTKIRHILMFFLLVPLVGNQCDSGTLFDEITATDLAAPIAVAVDPAKLRAYVVNSNNALEFTTTHLTILNLADPAAPVALDNPSNPIPMTNFSSQAYYDAVNGFLYTPNRVSDDATDAVDNLLRIHVDEASATFGQVDTFTNGENPFGIVCCDAQGRFYVINSGGEGPGTIDVYNPIDLSTFVQISLSVRLSSGENFNGRNSTEGVILGTQLFVTNRNGRLFVINTDEVGDTSKNPLDYVILTDNEGRDLRGIATDGTSLFVVDGKSKETFLRFLNPASVPPVSPDAAAIGEVDMSTLQTTTVSLGKGPNEVLVYEGKAYVTNREDDTLSVVDIANAAVDATVSLGQEPFGMAAFEVGGIDYLYVTNLVDDSISIVDPATNTVINTFAP